MSTLARRWGYVVVVAGLVVAWIMWGAVGVYIIDEDAFLATVAEFEDLPGMIDEGAVGTGAFGGVITTSYGYGASTGAVVAASIVACLLIVLGAMFRRRAIIPLVLTMAASAVLVFVVDAVLQTHDDPLLVARPLPLAVLAVASLIAFVAACVLLIDACRRRPPAVER